MANNIAIKKISPLDSVFVIAFVIGIIILFNLYTPYPDFIKYVLILGLFVYVGLWLPRFIGNKTRKNRAYKAKENERKKWGFYSRDREGPWINYIGYPLVKDIRGSEIIKNAKDKKFYSEWLIIHNGFITINPGNSNVNPINKTVEYNYEIRRTYAWDGCSPKIWFYWFILIGTPDLWNKLEDITFLNNKNEIDSKKIFWQKTHHASLVHDALYQYLGIQPISKRETDLLFYQMLRESGVSIITAKIYHLAVICFGARDIKNKDHEPPNSELTIEPLPNKGLWEWLTSRI